MNGHDLAQDLVGSADLRQTLEDGGNMSSSSRRISGVRVFISSTLGELAEERAAARRAI